MTNKAGTEVSPPENTQPEPTLDLLTPQEAAALLRISAGTLASWRHRYDPRWLPFVRVGNLVRYRRGDIHSFVRRQGNETALLRKAAR